MSEDIPRRGETPLAFDPSATADDARLIFIGRLRSPWKTSSECPKNLRKARERRGKAWVEIDSNYREALEGLDACSHILLLYWLEGARRDLIIQRQREGLTLKTFATRAPVRPNPVGIAAVKLVKLDAGAGRIDIDAIDCIDGTPLLDIKPYLPTVDAFPEATVAWLETSGSAD